MACGTSGALCWSSRICASQNAGPESVATAAHAVHSVFPVEQSQLEAERDLVHEVSQAADELVQAMGRGEPSERWRERRADIAELRERVRAMRDRHLHCG